MPSVVFTIPPLASVGFSEEEARRRGASVRVKTGTSGAWYSHRRIREDAGLFKTIVDDRTDHLLGAQIVGPAAEEIINIFALAIKHDIPAAALKATMFSYPTRSSDISSML